MSRKKATEKPSRESFTLNSDNERDRAVKLFLSTQNNKAETIKNIIYDYINNNDVKNSAIISTKNDVIINNGIKNDSKFNTKIDKEKKDSTKNDTKNSVNNYTIDIENEEDEEVLMEYNKDDNAIQNALAGLGI
ncbi:hypothetical protein [Clostridium neonatale]|uniref:hypothetical protein n=1 Tax=Clostridium neonatale TaxID=137838 RepID=UPI001B37F428|nr:hypothetical protein [Clostridium neonatale]MBP8314962.1 hypothetical protein [Clostridium neonatale]CAI3575407.1 conserved hypothetical protein [Clostridium neonatale]